MKDLQQKPGSPATCSRHCTKGERKSGGHLHYPKQRKETHKKKKKKQRTTVPPKDRLCNRKESEKVKLGPGEAKKENFTAHPQETREKGFCRNNT